MTWYAGCEGVDAEAFDTEDEATAHALVLAHEEEV